jgi:tRNA (cytidine/uridine-2'-O-)-methyltransferase
MEILLYGIEKGGNLGSIIRTASSFGLSRLYVFDEFGILDSVEEIKRAKDTSMGHFDEVELVSVGKDFFLGFSEVFATTVGKNAKRIGDPKFDVTFGKDCLIVFGNETRGIPRKVSGSKGVQKVIIPSRGMDHCLSLPVAFAIVCYEVLRQNPSLFPHRGR